MVSQATEAPQAAACSTSGADDSYTAQPQRLLCYFAHRLLDFRVPEINALAELAGCQMEEVKWEPPTAGELSPLWYVTLPSHAVAVQIAQRAVLLKVGKLR